MKNLDKMEVFRKCGFRDHNMILMPDISYNGYDEVMQYCYHRGYSEGQNLLMSTKYVRSFDATQTELHQQIKDLETANARLFERNHELQVDNEESLKEVENQYKIVAALRDDKAQLLERFDEHVEMITELRQENLEYSKRCDELRKQTLLYSEQIEKLYQLNGQLANSVVGTLETSPKSKFVITMEEF